MKEPVWVPKSVALALHDAFIAEFGGRPGMRDESLLESALARPRQLFSYDDPDLFALAVTIVSGILRNHPFIDGNKRTAFMVGYVFLTRNGRKLSAPEAEATQIIIALAAGKMTEKEFVVWLRENCE